MRYDRTPAADYKSGSACAFPFVWQGKLTVRYPSALLIPSSSALLSDAAILAYKAATLNSTEARSKVREFSVIGASGVKENGVGNGI